MGNNNIELSKNFIIDLNTFSELSREVGYTNCKVNSFEYDEHNDKVYDEESIEKYNQLRGQQLTILKMMLDFYNS